MASVTLLAASCGPAAPRATTTRAVIPLSPAERTSLQIKLLTGQPILGEPPAAEVARPTPPAPVVETPALSPDQTACRDFRKELPSNFVQGFVSVPEDWNKADSRKIRVYYYARLLRDAHNEVIRPTVFFNGGPGYRSYDGYDLLEHSSGAHQLSLIYIDQRGTGCSDSYPARPLTAETARRLSLYGSRSIVRDAEAVRIRLLGTNTKWAAFGQSYGGLITHRYVETAPESLSAAFIHGNAIVSDPVFKIVERLLTQNSVGQIYFAKYPDDEAKVREIRAQIPDSLCFNDSINSVCGPVIMDALAALLSLRTQWGSLHQLLGRILPEQPTGARVPPSIDQAELDEYVRTLVFGLYSFGDNGFPSTVLSHLEVVPSYTDVGVCQAATARILANTTAAPIKLWPINECRLLVALHYPGEDLIADSAKADPVKLSAIAAQLHRHPDLKFFLYSGELDVTVPASIFAEEIGILGHRITYRRFKRTGHDGFYNEPMIWDDLNSR